MEEYIDSRKKAKDMKKGDYMIIRGRPCKIISIDKYH